MHELHFCHRDLKPENLAWSPWHKKSIFIDFGLSTVVSVSHDSGSRVLAKYVGTYDYSSPEMKKLYFLREKGLVNLY